MIGKVALARGQLPGSRLAFGTSRLHYVGQADRQRLLALAVDCGICHFDTAPVYGDGLAERELGRFLKGRRSGLLIATKYGVAPDPIIAALPVLG